MRRRAKIDGNGDRYQRYRARQRGENVPKRRAGCKPKDFWSLVEKGDGCWLYRGRLNRDGYGEYNIGGGHQMAHRFAWRELRGEIPAGAILMHLCDITNCVNPDHLQIGTHQENQADKVRKGRQATGASVGSAKLTDETAGAIRAVYRQGARGAGSARAIGERYGVSADTVRLIGKLRRWVA